MNNNILFDAIGNVDDRYLLQSEKPTRIQTRKALGAIAACLCLVLICTAVFYPRPELPLIPLENGISGMGFESYEVFDSSELGKNNPLAGGANIKKLPVYKNESYNPYLLAYGLSEEEIMAELTHIAEFFDTEILGTEINTVADSIRDPRGLLIPGEAVTYIRAQTELAEIAVDACGDVDIEFHVPQDAELFSGQEEAVFRQLTEAYGELLQYENPQGYATVFYGASEGTTDFCIYDGGENKRDALLGYCFRYAQFYTDDNGDLDRIRLYDALATAEEIGVYPLISEAEALELLLGGYGYSSYMYMGEFPGEEYITKAELIYRENNAEKYYLPYYRFYVELPSEANEDGRKTYAAYYVPAVEAKYIAGMPTYTGGLNS